MRFSVILLTLLVLSLPASLSAQGSPETLPEEQAYLAPAHNPDPLETINRGIFAFNKQVDRFILKPVAEGYKWLVPSWGRARVGNFLNNLESPINMGNALLQFDFYQAQATFWRFFINTSLGLGGTFDQATSLGLEHRQEDFGQTLAVWGIPSGPYIVLPFIGPSNLRDTIGRIADTFMDPVSYAGDDEIYIPVTRRVVEIVHNRAVILPITNNIDATSLDPYATYRSAYHQRRQDLIHNGMVPLALEGE